MSAEAFPLIKDQEIEHEKVGSVVRFPSLMGESQFALLVFVLLAPLLLGDRLIE